MRIDLTGRKMRVHFGIVTMAALAVVFLAGCGGGGGAPEVAAAMGAGIDASAGRNPANTINSGNASTLEVSVEVAPEATGDETLTVSLDDGTTQVTASVAVPEGGGVVVLGPMDGTSLDDGVISLQVTMAMGDAQQTTSYAGAFFKDTIAPALPLVVDIPATATNPVSIVNSNNCVDLSVDVTFSTMSDSRDLVSISVSDGNTVVETSQQNVVPGATVTFSGIDVCGLTDGSLTVTSHLVDLAENSSTWSVDAVKDTEIPGVILARVAAGSHNGAGVINQHNHSMVVFTVVMDADADSNDQVTLTMSDGVDQVQSDAVACPDGGGLMTFAPMNVSTLADGTITLQVMVTDESLNSKPTPGAPAQKDTGVANPTQARIVAGVSNPANVINSNNMSDVSVEVIFDRQLEEGETISLVLSQDGFSVASGPVAVETRQDHVTLNGIDCTGIKQGTVYYAVTVGDATGNGGYGSGEAGTADTVAPAGHASLWVSTPGANAQFAINAANSSDVEVSMSLLPDVYDDRQARITLSDGFTHVTTPFFEVPAAGGLHVVSGIDATPLSDRPITLWAEYQDSQGNSLEDRRCTPTAKDTQIANAMSSTVLAGENNEAGIVNYASRYSVCCDVVLPQGAHAGDTYWVEFKGTTRTMKSRELPGIEGGGVLSFRNTDLSGLSDGPVGIVVVGMDMALNQSRTWAQQATKDVVHPAEAVSARVAAGPRNSDNEINGSNATRVEVSVSFSPLADQADFCRVHLIAGGTMISSPAHDVPGPNTRIVVRGIDARHLPDGPVSVRVETFDAAGNSSWAMGQSATKNTAAVQPVSAAIVAGSDNPAHYVNNASQGDVRIDVVMPAETTSLETVMVRVQCGDHTISTPLQSAPEGGGTISFAMNASGFQDGYVGLVVYVNSDNGNSSVFAGTPGIKDTEAPAPALLVSIPAGGKNPVGWVNAETQSGAAFEAKFWNNYQGTETVELTVTDGTTQVNGGQQGISPAGGFMTFSPMDCSSLNDGPLSVTMLITDAAWNQTTATYYAGQKDTVAPDAPVSGFIAPGPQNATDVVNSFNETAVRFSIETAAGTELGTRVDLEVWGPGGGHRTTSTYHLQTPGGRETVASLNCSNIEDGTVNWTVYMFDPAWNRRDWHHLSAVKDTVAPAMPASANILAGSQNPAGYINMFSNSSTFVDVVFASSSDASDTVSVSLGAGAATTPVNAPQGGGTMTFGPLDATTLPEGIVGVGVTLKDRHGNTAVFAGANGTKDSLPPVVPTSLQVAEGAGNTVNHISMNNQNAVMVEASWPSTVTGDETVELTVGSTTFAAQSVLAHVGTQHFPIFSAGAVVDGLLALSVRVTEPSGNAVTFNGTMVTKDTVPPVDPVSAVIPAGQSNPGNVINGNNAAQVVVEVSWPSSADAGDSAVVNMTDGWSQMDGMDQTINPAPRGSENFGAAQSVHPGSTTTYWFNTTTFIEGAISLTVTSTDQAGNISTFSGAPVSKDTTAPGITAALVPSGPGPRDFISPLNASSVTFETLWESGTDGTETMTITFTDGVSTVVAGPMTAPVGGGSLQVSNLDCSGLNDGEVTTTVSTVDVVGNTLDMTGSIRKLTDNSMARFVVAHDEDSVSAYAIVGARLERHTMTDTGAQATGVVADPGGSWIFASHQNAAPSVFSFDPTTGGFTSTPGTGFTANNTGVEFHPFMPMAFAVDSVTGQVDRFDWDSATGSMTHAQSTGSAGSGALDMAIDPSGRFVYVVTSAGSVETYSIDSSTGELTSVGVVGAGVEPVAVVCDGRGEFAYVANSVSGDISIFQIDNLTGALVSAGTTSPTGGQMDLAFATAHYRLYSVNRVTSSVEIHQQDPGTGALTLVTSHAFLATPRALVIDQQLGRVFVQTSEALHMMTIDGTGSLVEECLVSREGSDGHISLVRGGTVHDHVMQFAHVANDGTNDVSSFTVDNATGILTATGSAGAGVGAGLVAGRPQNDFIFVASSDGNVHSYSVDSSTGVLTAVGTPTMTGGVPTGMVVDPTGEFLYVTENTADTMEVFFIDGSNGNLTAAGNPVSTGAGVADLAMRSGHANHAFSLGGTFGDFGTWVVDRTSGSMVFVSTLALTGGANSMAVHPSGNHVFVANGIMNDVTTLAVDAGGTASSNGATAAGTTPVDVVVSPTGDFVYVLNNGTSDVSVYSFDGTSLTSGGSAAVGGDPVSMHLSPRGDFLYCVDTNSGANGMVHRFDVDTATGALSNQQTQAVSGDGSWSMTIQSKLQ